MDNIKFIKDYKHMPQARTSFIRRMREIFNFDMERLYAEGYWSEAYIPYSFSLDGEIIANVSAISQDFLCDGVIKKGVVIEAVLSVPEFRGRGLAGRLMRMVLEEYEKSADFICLYSVPSALEFYPRFGFSRVREHRYVIKNALVKDGGLSKRKLDLEKPEDFEQLKYFVEHSVPVSKKFSVTSETSFLMFELKRRAKDMLWYLDAPDALVAAEERDGAFHINYFLAMNPPDTDVIINHFPSESPRDFVFGYTPDILSNLYAGEFLPVDEAAFFIRGETPVSGQFMTPYYFRS